MSCFHCAALCSITVALFATVHTLDAPIDEGSVLLEFASAVSDLAGDLITQWTNSGPVCEAAASSSWPGVTCSRAGRVEELRLDRKGLTGTLPNALAELRGLSIVSLEGNNLTGTLPAKWKSLRQLETVNIADNSLSGWLPLAWADLPQLKEVSLQNNRISGHLHREWGGMHSLYKVNLEGNELGGTLPESWGRLGRLTILSLARNSFHGTLPDVWKALERLVSLNLHENLLSGTMPQSWKGLSELRYLNLVGNSLKGALPGMWSELTSVQQILLDANHISGAIPASWARMHQLLNLGISGNKDICGTVDQKLLNIAIDDTTGTQLNQSCRWQSEAHSLMRFRQSITGDPKGVLRFWEEHRPPCGNPTWRGLECSDGAVVTIDLSRSNLQGSLGQELTELRSLNKILLNMNRFTGTLPATWSGFHALKTLHLANNAIIGALPDTWASLRTLSHLDIDANMISGHLPAAWTGFESIEYMSLRRNRLTGTLPDPWITKISTLSRLHLGRNTLEGTLPKGWMVGRHPNLTELTLDRNRFHGMIPSSWALHVEGPLRLFSVEGNFFMCGFYPKTKSDLYMKAYDTGIGDACPSLEATLSGSRVMTAVGLTVVACLLIGIIMAATAHYVTAQNRRSQQMQPSRRSETAATYCTANEGSLSTLRQRIGAPHSINWLMRQRPQSNCECTSGLEMSELATEKS